MGRKRTKVDYRQLYKDYYDIQFGSDMVVHHIDFNRQNNSIDNLILLPRRLHNKYHFCLNVLASPIERTKISFDAGIDLHGNEYERAMLRHLCDALDEIEKWRVLKVRADIARFDYDR